MNSLWSCGRIQRDRQHTLENIHPFSVKSYKIIPGLCACDVLYVACRHRAKLACSVSTGVRTVSPSATPPHLDGCHGDGAMVGSANDPVGAGRHHGGTCKPGDPLPPENTYWHLALREQEVE